MTLTQEPAQARTVRNAGVRTGELASVHSWELVTAVDGPGTRMTIFLSGCPLRCLYCHNPDTMQMRMGRTISFDDIASRVNRYRPVFKATKGGVTISGGEPLMQPAFVERLVAWARDRGIHTAIDTSGNLGANASDDLLSNLDLVLLDVKSGDEETYKRVTGRELAPTLRFGERLMEAGVETWIRFVLVPGLTDSEHNVNNVADIVAKWTQVTRVEVLPFHQMGRDKWESIGMRYQLDDVEPPSPEHTEWARNIFRERGLTVY